MEILDFKTKKLVVANEIPGCFVITWRKVAQYTSKT